ncbi:MAG: sulfite exporter TauE/SafE family protein [Candidatus Cloacimonetes bacterium]|nr:sulfite exporter TauE/SafE family protein [Candidatus Cloacimonadota bacterium]
MFETLLNGAALGLATGTSCLATCSPIYLPYLISEDRKLSKSLLAVMEISAGRFVSYLAFGALAGFAGAKIATTNREIFTSIAYILLSIYLVFSAVRTDRKSKGCNIPKMTKFTQNGIFLGILTGINFCPSFLIALSKAVDLGGVTSGMMLFLGFFFGTSVFLIPLAFIGQLSKVSIIKTVAQYASILVAIWFTFAGVNGLKHYYEHQKSAENTRYVEVFKQENNIIIISSQDNWEYFSILRDSLQKYSANKITIAEGNIGILKNIPSPKILFLDAEIPVNELNEFDYFVVENNHDISKIIKFVQQYTFKTSTNLHWEFKKK